jgi:hypothetical protein
MHLVLLVEKIQEQFYEKETSKEQLMLQGCMNTAAACKTITNITNTFHDRINNIKNEFLLIK